MIINRSSKTKKDETKDEEVSLTLDSSAKTEFISWSLADMVCFISV